jgi:hypothetical protein
MPFQPPRFPSLRPLRGTGPLFSVGRRVFVNCPGKDRGGVPLMDDAGHSAVQSLPDGAEVEILAWRPRGAGSTRYRVHATRDGVEGWLAADHLRASVVPTPPAELTAPMPPRPVAPPAGRAPAGNRRVPAAK